MKRILLVVVAAMMLVAPAQAQAFQSSYKAWPGHRPAVAGNVQARVVVGEAVKVGIGAHNVRARVNGNYTFHAQAVLWCKPRAGKIVRKIVNGRQARVQMLAREQRRFKTFGVTAQCDQGQRLIRARAFSVVRQIDTARWSYALLMQAG